MRLAVVALLGLSCGGGTRGAPATAAPAAKLACADDAACDRLENAAFVDVHTYLDEDDVVRAAVPVLRARCDAGVMRACQRLGILHRHGAGGVARDRDRSFVLFERACNGGFLPACTDAGYAYESAEGATANAALAAALYRKACDDGDLLGCSNLGALHESGNGVPKDEARARALYQKACDGDHPPGCRNLGLAWLDGIGGGVDEDRGASLVDRACTDLDAVACAHLAELTFDGRGVLADPEHAVELASYACDEEVGWMCVDLGLRFENADDVPKDEERAATLYRRACDLESWMGCNNLGVLTQDGKGGLEKSDLGATNLYVKACDGGTALGCRNAGWMYEENRVPDVGEEEADRRSTELYRRGCDLNDAAACSYLGEAYRKGRGIERNAKVAVRFLVVGCDGGDNWGCTELGIAHEYGDGVPKDEAKARELYRRACAGENWRGCAHLAELLKEGRGGPFDLAEAQAMAELACREEDEVGCDHLGDIWFEGNAERVIDEHKALEAWDRACTFGSKDGCADAAMLFDDGYGQKFDTARLKPYYQKGCNLGDDEACESFRTQKDDKTPPSWKWDDFAASGGKCGKNDLVSLVGGKFTMGAPEVAGRDDEHPEHEVELSPYKLMRTEVTMCQYRECVKAGKCTPPDTTAMDESPRLAMEPITGVTWDQAAAYCAWKKLRLPTEAEWEFAARGTDGRMYAWGDTPPSCLEADWQPTGVNGLADMFCDGNGPSVVGKHPAGASPFGLLDMSGNVREWTSTWMHKYGPDPIKDPRGPATGTSRVARGGGWHNTKPEFLTTTVRFRLAPTNANVAVGFRCAK